jgi:Beta-glucosidase-related glycosidases
MESAKEYRLSFTEKAREVVSQMSLDEKIRLMGGKRGFFKMFVDNTVGGGYNRVPYAAGGNRRLGVPEMLFCDGPRGVVAGNSTCFPVSMARGATFEPDLERRVGEAIGKEIRAHGGNFFGGVCINLPYHPSWGRSQETYGEDTVHIGRMGASLVKGVQSEGVIACIKHFAFNSMENVRFKVSVTAGERAVREIFLRHFKECVDAGAASVMSAYNKFEGTHCGHNKRLLNDILKDEWGFDGFVISDFTFGLRDTYGGLSGGLDIEMCNTNHYKPSKVKKLIESGKISESVIDGSATRIVRTLLAFAENKKEYGKETVASSEHTALALEAAEKSITLIKNRGVLPFDEIKTKTVVLIGDLSDEKNIGDHGSSRVRPPYIVTLKEALEKDHPDKKIIFIPTAKASAGRERIEKADAVIISAGCRHADEGEYLGPGMGGGDRLDLGLRKSEVEMIKAVSSLNPKTALVLYGGNMLLMRNYIDEVPAALMAYYPGMEGGRAVAEILFGKVNPSGKLPFVVVRRMEDLPKVDFSASEQFYGYYHGYQKTDKEGSKIEFPYGYGLSYTSFKLHGAKILKIDKDKAEFSVTLKNTGKRSGAEVVQLYVGCKNSAVDRPVKALKDFQKVYLDPGEIKTVDLSVLKQDLAYYDEKEKKWIEEDIDYIAYIGTDAENAMKTEVEFRFN